MDDEAADYNRLLTINADRRPSADGGRGFIEKADDKYYNIPWQTRFRQPTEYEEDLSKALEAIFTAGASTLDEISAGLNKAGPPPPGGGAWTADLFARTMQELSEQKSDGAMPGPTIGAGIVPRN